MVKEDSGCLLIGKGALIAPNRHMTWGRDQKASRLKSVVLMTTNRAVKREEIVLWIITAQEM